MLFELQTGNSLDYLFIYGTLLDVGNNEYANFLRQNSSFFSNGYLQGRIIELGEYPAAIMSNNPADRVNGKVMLIENAGTVFPVLDEYEGAAEFPVPGNEYIRKKVPIHLDHGILMECWIYLFQQE